MAYETDEEAAELYTKIVEELPRIEKRWCTWCGKVSGVCVGKQLQ